MDVNLLTPMVPIIVTIVGALLAYFTASSSKEKEVKLKKYEDLGMEVFSFFEELYFLNSALLKVVKNEMANKNQTTKTSSIKLRDEYNNNSSLKSNVKIARDLTIKLFFVDRNQKKIFDNFLSLHQGAINKTLRKTSIRSNKQLNDVEYSHSQLYLLANQQVRVLNKILLTKESITDDLSKKYHKTIGSNKVLPISFSLLLILITAVFYYSQPSKKEEIKKEPKTYIQNNYFL